MYLFLNRFSFALLFLFLFRLPFRFRFSFPFPLLLPIPVSGFSRRPSFTFSPARSTVHTEMVFLVKKT